MNNRGITFGWDLCYSCNYRCPYCGIWEEKTDKDLLLSTNEWTIIWHRIYERYGSVHICVSGGEPSTYPYFFELMKALSKEHTLEICTNLSWDVDRLVSEISPEILKIAPTFHPTFVKFQDFFKKIIGIKEYLQAFQVYYVAYPGQIMEMSQRSKMFKEYDIDLIPMPLRRDGFMLNSEDEKRIIENISPYAGNKISYQLQHISPKGKLCMAGQRYAVIRVNGRVDRCSQYSNGLLGDLLDENFKLLNEAMPCDKNYCPIESQWILENNKQAEIEEEEKIKINSSVNNEEYNLGALVLKSSPKAIFIQAAGLCNSSCVFCSRGTGYEVFNLEAHRKHFEKTLYPFISSAERLILTGSGEFLQLPEAGKILDFFDSSFPKVEKCFSTNGASLTPWVCERIVGGKSSYTIHISLHASNAELHKVLTRTDIFDKILSQIKYLLGIRKNKEKIKVHFIFVATTLNIEDFPNFIRLTASLGGDKIICYYNYIYVSTQKYLSCFFKQELTNKIFEEAKFLANKLNIEVIYPPKFNQKEYADLGICREAWGQIMFDAKGHVLPCDASEDCGEILSDGRGFMDIWDGHYYQRLRKSLLERTNACFNHCFRANPKSVNDFKSHVIHRGKNEHITELWSDNF